MERALSQNNAKERLSTTQYEQLLKSVHEIVAHKQLTAFFDPANTPYKERALFTTSGELLRPDRFVFTPDKNVLLLDYKTGKHYESHASQLEEYAKCLKQQGLNVKQKALVYCGKNLIFKEV